VSETCATAIEVYAIDREALGNGVSRGGAETRRTATAIDGAAGSRSFPIRRLSPCATWRNLAQRRSDPPKSPWKGSATIGVEQFAEHRAEMENGRFSVMLKRPSRPMPARGSSLNRRSRTYRVTIRRPLAQDEPALGLELDN